MPLFLCCDCGGSKTSAVICDETGEIRGRAYGGPSNFAYLTVEQFSLAVETAISDALKTCVSPPSVDPVALPPPAGCEFAAAWFGVSGVDSDAAIANLTAVLSPMLGIPEGPRLMVGNDTQLLASPLRFHPEIPTAVTCVGGTGSIAVSFDRDPENASKLRELGRTGGWGWILGDEGGGFGVGREAVRHMMLDADKASCMGVPPPKSTLTPRILEFFNVKTEVEVLAAAHMSDPVGPPAVNAPGYLTMAREKRLSSLSPLVFTAAFEEGDALALRVLNFCAHTLAEYIAIPLIGGRIQAKDSLLSFGGTLVGIDKYRQLVLDKLADMGHVFKLVEWVDDAAVVGCKSLAAAFKA